MLNPESPSTAPALIDPASKAFQSLLDKLAPTEATVLIVGETGTARRWWPAISIITAPVASSRFWPLTAAR